MILVFIYCKTTAAQIVTFPFGHIWAQMGTKWHELARLGTFGVAVERLTVYRPKKTLQIIR
jgi:hypothetical protein